MTQGLILLYFPTIPIHSNPYDREQCIQRRYSCCCYPSSLVQKRLSSPSRPQTPPSATASRKRRRFSTSTTSHTSKYPAKTSRPPSTTSGTAWRTTSKTRATAGCFPMTIRSSKPSPQPRARSGTSSYNRVP